MQKRILKEIDIKSGNTDANILEVQLSYNKGGMNYFSGTNEQRGLYLSVTPVNVSRKDGYSTRSFTAFSGIKMLVKEMKRFSQKTLNEFEPSKEDLDKLIRHVAVKHSLEI